MNMLKYYFSIPFGEEFTTDRKIDTMTKSSVIIKVALSPPSCFKIKLVQDTVIKRIDGK